MVDFILDPQNVGWLGSIAALGTPLAAAALALILVVRFPRIFRSPFLWMFAASGPLVVALWFLFNAIENKFGLDSVVGLILNLLLFCLIGLVLGLALMILWKRSLFSRNHHGSPKDS